MIFYFFSGAGQYQDKPDDWNVVVMEWWKNKDRRGEGLFALGGIWNNGKFKYKIASQQLATGDLFLAFADCWKLTADR